MVWRKLGLVYVASDESSWARTHAFLPTPYALNKKIIRIYAAFLDKHKIGRIGFVDVSVDNPLKIVKISKNPVLDIGFRGVFDDSGVTPISLVKIRDKVFLYYVGWQLGVKVRYYLFTGLAVGNRNMDKFKRFSLAPILDRTNDELFIRSAAYVRADSKIYRMWYVAGSKWIKINGKELPTYNLRYLESKDGVYWGKKGTVCLDVCGDKDEYGLGRPFVIKENKIYKMWYSIRTMSKGYRLGYAESDDGLHWKRNDDKVGIDVSKDGWDSKMICFSSIIDINNKRYMFYNGNNYGESGFGVAILEK